MQPWMLSIPFFGKMLRRCRRILRSLQIRKHRFPSPPRVGTASLSHQSQGGTHRRTPVVPKSLGPARGSRFTIDCNAPRSHTTHRRGRNRTGNQEPMDATRCQRSSRKRISKSSWCPGHRRWELYPSSPETNIARNQSIKDDASFRRDESHEYRSAEYEYEYDENLLLRSYSVRDADGTRTRHRTRCCSITSIMFGISITMDGSSENLKVARKPKQPSRALTATIPSVVSNSVAAGRDGTPP